MTISTPAVDTSFTPVGARSPCPASFRAEGIKPSCATARSDVEKLRCPNPARRGATSVQRESLVASRWHQPVRRAGFGMNTRDGSVRQKRPRSHAKCIDIDETCDDGDLGSGIWISDTFQCLRHFPRDMLLPSASGLPQLFWNTTGRKGSEVDRDDHNPDNLERIAYI